MSDLIKGYVDLEKASEEGTQQASSSSNKL